MTEELYVTDWYSSDVVDDDDDSGSGSSDDKSKRYQCSSKFTVKAFCLDEKGDSVVLNVTGFEPYYYIKVPNTWSAMQSNMLGRGLRGKVRKWYADALTGWKLVNAKPLYGFTANDKFRYMRLNFSCISAFYEYRKALDQPIRIFGLMGNKSHKYEQYESNLQPLLRFLHCNNIQAVGWVKIQDFRSHICNNTHSKREITVAVTGIKPLERENIPALKYVGYDIEADSSHGDFPLANKDYRKLAQDIVTEYINVKGEKLYSDMRPVVATFLKYAFHGYYNNNNINSVTLVNGTHGHVQDILTSAPYEAIPGISSLIDMHLSSILEILDNYSLNDVGEVNGVEVDGDEQAEAEQAEAEAEQEQAAGSKEKVITRTAIGNKVEPSDTAAGLQAIEDILDIFEMNFPEIDINVSDYYSVSEQLVLEWQRLGSINDTIFQQSPEDVLRLLLELVFNPYFKNYNINKIYNQSRPPVGSKLQLLVPSINSICEEAYTIIVRDRKYARYRRNGVKISKPKGGPTVDDSVVKLTELFNSHLPDVQDDRVIQIGSVFKRYGESDCYLKHIICLNDTEEIKRETIIDFEYTGVTLPSKVINAELEDYPYLKDVPESERNDAILDRRRQAQYKTDTAEVIVECYDTEEEVLLAWQELMIRENPGVVVGYNTFGFDYKYLYDRAEKLGIQEKFSELGRIKGVSQKLIEKKLQSAGLGDNLLHYIEMHGRISIDLYKVIQNMYKLNSYKLDSVCKEFLFKSKVDVSPAEIFVRQRGNAADRRVVAEYCLIDCVLCVRLIDKLELILNNIGMAQVCSVPLSYLFLRGQGIKLFSYVAKICRQEGSLIPVLGDPEDEGKYEGAIVLDPDKGIHYDPVVVADFNSLYPSCIISENLSHNSFVGFKVVKKGANTEYRGRLLTDNRYERNLIEGIYPGWDYIDIVYDVYKEVPVRPGCKKQKKIVVGHKICRFAQPPDEKKDIVPKILTDLLASRKKAKKTRDKFPSGSFRYNIYEGLQLAYKVTANSLYGILGASTSQIRCREIAACTTATGRKLIHFSADYVKKNYEGCEITYGDTDSIFCKFKCFDRYGNKLVGLDAINKCILYCTESSMCISKQLRKPHNLEFEKAILPFILLSKKRYHGHYYTSHGSDKFYPQSMGIVLKRRDNAPIVKHVFGKMIDIIMKDHSIEKAMGFVREECRKVLNGDFGLDMFIITKTLRSYYKNRDQIAHNVLAQRIGKRDPGNKPRGNDRIAYVFIINPDAEMQGDRIETPEYVKKHNCKLDYSYYITNQIMKPILQIFALGDKGESLFDEILKEYHSAGLQKLSDDFQCINMLERAQLGDHRRRSCWQSDGDIGSDDEDRVSETSEDMEDMDDISRMIDDEEEFRANMEDVEDDWVK